MACSRIIFSLVTTLVLFSYTAQAQFEYATVQKPITINDSSVYHVPVCIDHQLPAGVNLSSFQFKVDSFSAPGLSLTTGNCHTDAIPGWASFNCSSSQIIAGATFVPTALTSPTCLFKLVVQKGSEFCGNSFLIYFTDTTVNADRTSLGFSNFAFDRAGQFSIEVNIEKGITYQGTTAAKCPDSAYGSISVQASSSAGSLMYSIDGTNFQSSPVFDSVTAGTYGVYLKNDLDTVGCYSYESLTITDSTSGFQVPDTTITESDSVTHVLSNFDSYLWSNDEQGSSIKLLGSSLGQGTHEFWVRVTTASCTLSDTFTVTVIADTSSNSGDTNTNDTTTSHIVTIQSIDLLKAYPTLFDEFVVVENNHTAALNILIRDVTGRPVLQTALPVGQSTLPLGHLNRGTYFLDVRSQGSVVKTKVLLKR